MSVIKFKIDFPEYGAGMFSADKAANMVLKGLDTVERFGGRFDTRDVFTFMRKNNGRAGSIEINVQIDIIKSEWDEVVKEITNSLPSTHKIIFMPAIVKNNSGRRIPLKMACYINSKKDPIDVEDFLINPLIEKGFEYDRSEGINNQLFILGLKQNADAWELILQINGTLYTYTSICNEETTGQARFDKIANENITRIITDLENSINEKVNSH